MTTWSVSKQGEERDGPGQGGLAAPSFKERWNGAGLAFVREEGSLDHSRMDGHDMRIKCALELGMGNRARKQATNLSIRSDLLRQAKARKINLSKTLEESLEKILREQDRQAWLEENREAIEAANRFVDRHGLWSDGLRQF